MLELRSTEELTKLLDGDEFSFHFEYGYGKTLHQMQLIDAHELVEAVWLHVVCWIPHVELLQLQKGFGDTFMEYFKRFVYVYL